MKLLCISAVRPVASLYNLDPSPGLKFSDGFLSRLYLLTSTVRSYV
jgi:hypothetical protein